MSLLFSPIKVGPMTIKNRFMRSPAHEHLSNPDGTPKPKVLKLMEQLSKNEVGLVIPGYVYISESGKALTNQCALYNQKHADAWKSCIKKIQKNGSKFVFQICHAGIAVNDPLEKKGPSTFPGQFRALTKSEIGDIIDEFTKSAVLAQKAGADGVELHGAHGYLLSVFLSPFYNYRDDEYGGSVEGRARIVAETAESIRKTCGSDFSILIKMNGNDFLPTGVTPELASKYVNFLKKKIDMFEISCGCNSTSIIHPDIKKRKLLNYTYGLVFKEGYTLEYAEKIKQDNPDTVIASVGGWRHAKQMDDAVKNKGIDMISLARPLIREPNLVKKIKANPNTVSACISCNHCLYFNDEKGLRCDYP